MKDRAEQILSLKAELVAKDEALAFLIDQTDSLNLTINEYVEAMGQQESKIGQLEALNKELNKAYLIIGTYDELKDKGVVDKEGGFLGLIGRKMTLQENVDLKQFMAVDKRDISRLTIDANQFSLVSEHPSDSYSILPGDTEQMKILEVTNPDTFWQISQYLVISKKT